MMSGKNSLFGYVAAKRMLQDGEDDEYGGKQLNGESRGMRFIVMSVMPSWHVIGWAVCPASATCGGASSPGEPLATHFGG